MVLSSECSLVLAIARSLPHDTLEGISATPGLVSAYYAFSSLPDLKYASARTVRYVGCSTSRESLFD